MAVMKDKERLILMYKDFEVLSFDVDYVNEKVHFLEKLAHYDKVPFFIAKLSEDKDMNVALYRFLNRRCIPVTRTGYKEILEATGAKSGFVLSFQGHGLSLSSHYWYKREGENLRYEDINFFTNKWDDTFGRACINQDYKALKNCDLNVPDIMTAGWGQKGWVYEEDGPKLYKLGINENHSEEALGEVLASNFARRIFNEGEALKYELRKVGDRYASVSPVMINIDEDLIPLSEYLSGEIHVLYRQKSINKELIKDFLEAVKKSEIPGLYEFFIKISCLKDLCFVSDLHFDNISLIKNEKTGQIRIAPIYDLGGAFGSSRSGQSLISNPNKATLIMIYYMYSDLEPDWDYSWYDSDKLIGYEEEIIETLSKSSFYTPDLLECVIEVYRHQKSVIDEYKRGHK